MLKPEDLFCYCRACGNKMNLLEQNKGKMFCNEVCRNKHARKIKALIKAQQQKKFFIHLETAKEAGLV